MDPGRRVSFERDCSSKAAAVLEQMKELLRRAGLNNDVEVMEREGGRGREREREGRREGERERERERGGEGGKKGVREGERDREREGLTFITTIISRLIFESRGSVTSFPGWSTTFKRRTRIWSRSLLLLWTVR